VTDRIAGAKATLITSVSIVLDASPSVKVVTELQLTIETILRADADPITDVRHIPHQIVVSWNAKLHGLYITLFAVCVLLCFY